jgi:hypothetical protein
VLTLHIQQLIYAFRFNPIIKAADL